MAPAQFVNVIKFLNTLQDTGKQYNEVMKKIMSELKELNRGFGTELLDDADAQDAERLLKEYRKQREVLMKATAKGPLTKHLFSKKGTATLTQPEKKLLKEFLSGEDTKLTEQDLKDAGVRLNTESGKKLLDLIGDGYTFPKILTVNKRTDATEEEVTAANIQKYFSREDQTGDRFSNNRDWFEAHKLAAGSLAPSFVKFREDVSKKQIQMSDRTTQQQPKPSGGGGVRGKAKEIAQKAKEEEERMKAEEALEKDAAEKVAEAGRVDLSRKKALERSGAGTSSTGEELTGPDPPEPPAPAPATAGASDAGDVQMPDEMTGPDPPEAPAPAPGFETGPVSDGEKRLASKGLIDNPEAAAKAQQEAEEELKRAQMAAINAFKDKARKEQHEGKGAASGTGVTMAPTLDTIEEANESIAADIEESEANRNEAAKILQKLARLRSKVNAARAFTQRMREEQADTAKPDFTNLSTRVPQREAGAPEVSTLPPATKAERIPGTADAGTDTAPVQNLVMENVSRGREEDTPGVGEIMKGTGTSEKDDEKEVARLSIEGAKDRIRALHTVFDDLIPAFKAAPHTKDRDDALQSKDEKVVKKHLLSMLKKVREYYSGGPSGLRVGVVIPAQAIIQSLLRGAVAAPAVPAAPAAPVAAAPAPATAPFGMGGRTPDHPGSVIHKKGSDPYGVGMSIAIHRRNSGMASFLKKGVAGHAITNVEPVQPGKVSKPVIKMNQNAPMNGNMGIVLGRTPKSLGIKIKTGKR